MTVTIHPSFQKTARSARDAGHERAILRLIEGDGVVPVQPTDNPAVVATAHGTGSVADLLATRGTLSEQECRAIGARAAHALAGVHEKGIAHGDLKPANLVFAPDGDLWLIDFDSAAAVGSPRTRAHRVGSPIRPPSPQPTTWCRSL